ncbi:hypothetical protein WJX84_000437 [Apatococcus fuscideae]|uniref:Ubiquitin-like domain-containing protein n=1 Tax=Apatococcus fuscideae TaxID=2026836 RepID=A0AAW1T5W5_9CHLO
MSRKVSVRLLFGESIIERQGKHHIREIEVAADGSDSILAIKQKLAMAFGGKVTSDDFRLVFGPNDRKIGGQYRNDPSVDESQLKLQQFSVLTWLDKFPHWQITARPIQQTPPPPGVAIKKAAATAEGKDPEKAVTEARSKGEIPALKDLTAPWGPKPYKTSLEDLKANGYLPPQYLDSPLSPLEPAAPSVRA